MLKKFAAGFFILTIFSILVIYFFTLNSTSGVLSASKEFDYTFVFVGDSMTEYLGNFDYLGPDLKAYYPQKNFLLLNYGYSSTNILSLPDRVEKDSTHSGRIFQPINDIPFDVIFIESMGHNPLSQFPLDQGLKMQSHTLDIVVGELHAKHPNAKIIFIATIAPSKDKYGEGTVTLNSEQRANWVNERNAYIENHIAYAKAHGIPLLNIYADSVDKNGNVNLDLVNPADFIHPSPTGVRFISQEIAAFVYSNQLIH